eukprot:scaffold3337_cov95-Cylindrotheca_fusiformis.AAC.8
MEEIFERPVSNFLGHSASAKRPFVCLVIKHARPFVHLPAWIRHLTRCSGSFYCSSLHVAGYCTAKGL